MRIFFACIFCMSLYVMGQSQDCLAPDSLRVEQKTDSTAVIQWDTLMDVDTFFVFVNNVDENISDTLNTTSFDITLDSLSSCTNYAVFIASKCDAMTSEFSDTLMFRTFGCGTCLDSIYCEVGTNQSNTEFIDSFAIGDFFLNISGDNGGYAFFDDLELELMPGEEYPVEIRQGGVLDYTENYRIYLDMDQNGQFDHPEELIVGTNQAIGIMQDTFEIPVDALEGSTRMRVIMNFQPFGLDTACGQFDFGEIEDYCVTILPANAPCDQVDSLRIDGLVGSTTNIIWEQVENSIVFNYRWREFNTEEFEEELATLDTFATISGLEECRTYEFQVQTICPADTSEYTTYLTFITDCPTGTENLSESIHMQTNPNPFLDKMSVAFDTPFAGEFSVTMTNLLGQPIRRKNITASAGEQQFISFDGLDDIAAGVYLIRIQFGNQQAVRKIIKQKG